MPINPVNSLKATLLGSILNKRKNFSGGLAGLLEDSANNKLLAQVARSKPRRQRSFIPANLAIADRIRSSASRTRVGVSNLSNAENRSSSASAALDGASQIVNRLGELSAIALDSTLSDADRAGLNGEAQALKQELTDLQANASYNGQKVLQGNTNTHFAGDDNNVSITDADLTGVNANLAALDLSTQAGASAALTSTGSARSDLSTEQARVGAGINRLQRNQDLGLTIAANQENSADQIRVNELGEIGSLFDSSIASVITELFGFKF
jgi:flagellin-like hook-associated protein FlgL